MLREPNTNQFTLRRKGHMARHKQPALAGISLILFAAMASAQTVTTLVSFAGGNGDEPIGPLVQGLNGDFYGVTAAGGAYNGGTVFKMTSTGRLKTLYNFTGGADGAGPESGLLLATDGDFYGTTNTGGENGKGVVFKITASGTETTLHSFTGADGANPEAVLVQGSRELFYGVTLYGGANNAGALFEITSTGTLTLLYSFSGPDGTLASGLMLASDGNLYGTTLAGGAHGWGTIFVWPIGGPLQTLYSFTGNADSGLPWNQLVEVSAGVFYGTTIQGQGTDTQWGTIFSITQDGTLTTLHTFDGHDGVTPEQLILGTDGNLYGTAEDGGTGNGYGDIFQMTQSGTLTVLCGFNTSGPIGDDPTGGLLEGTDGIFYGTNSYGGSGIVGTIYQMSTGLAPFVNTLPASGKVGATVKILGTNLTGATLVPFNGTPAEFTVVSATQIKAVVPRNATTGKVGVTTPGGTLVSAQTFQVP